MTYKTQTQQALFDPFVDEQVIAQAELEEYIEAQAQAIAPEELTSVEISFYEHEIYHAQKLIARITHEDDDFETQRWVVMINSVEIHRASTWAKCHSYITYHYKQGELPVQEEETPATTTGNEIMASIAHECEKFGLELLEDGIYKDNQKLGQVGCSNGRWWVVLASSADLGYGAKNKSSLLGCFDTPTVPIAGSIKAGLVFQPNETQTQVPCDSAFDAVWSLSMVSAKQFKIQNSKCKIEEPATPSTAAMGCEQLLDRPFDQLTPREWNRLLKYKPTDETEDLVAA
ncbi:hypothetical protein [Fischerella sp. PCC 9605]|uniref:hypothetical protein n=1 Tax=Fischerella sp. PCC 9605 TaxID=1173024 RepID=UPI0004B123F3|nr:hypothetical protein [Fischerella sp. PCC 9605]